MEIILMLCLKTSGDAFVAQIKVNTTLIKYLQNISSFVLFKWKRYVGMSIVKAVTINPVWIE